MVASIVGQAIAYMQIKSGNECMDCLRDTSKWRSVCRSDNSELVSYCCDTDDISRERVCKESPICSWLLPDDRMHQLACPVEDFQCKQSTRFIRLNLGESWDIRIGQFFNENETCHYTFEVPDEVDSVDSSNYKFMQIYVEQFDALDIFIGAAKTEYKMLDRDIQKVSLTNRNFTMPPTKKYFVSVNGTKGAQYNQYAGVIKFRYYKWQSGCPEFTNWDGKQCVANYTAYCASLTPSYIRKTGN